MLINDFHFTNQWNETSEKIQYYKVNISMKNVILKEKYQKAAALDLMSFYVSAFYFQ